MHMAKLHVNGETVELDVDDNTPLLWVLREQLGLTGTKYSCGIGRCGACTVHIDGEAVRACVVPVGSLGEAQDVVTIEGLSPDGSHPVQQAWAELDVPHCSTATPPPAMPTSMRTCPISAAAAPITGCGVVCTAPCS
jgi:isoquinoline 1-oxidoreductase alpha subunit